MSSHDRSRWSLPARIAVVEEKVDDVEQELQRHRDRLHTLESDRATLRMVTEKVGELANNIEAIAKRAAIDGIDLALEHRDELGHRRWSLRLAWAGAGVGIGGLVVSVAFHFAG